MDLEDAFDAVAYRGDSVVPPPGRHDLRVLVARAVCRLPAAVRDWLLRQTQHVFIGGHGQLAEYFALYAHPESPGLADAEETLRLRVIFLSEQLMARPEEEVLRSIVAAIAHSWLNQHAGSAGEQVDADRLVKKWGFARGRAGTAAGPRPGRPDQVGPAANAAGRRNKPRGRPRKGKKQKRSPARKR